MSVPKSKRGKSQLEIVTKSNELATYTIHICSNEQHFPKRYRWCITAKIVDAAVDISRFIIMANSIFVGDDPAMYKLRKQYQTQALASTYSLLSMMDIAYRTFGIDGDRINHWAGLVMTVQNLLRSWKKSDEQRYSSLG